jgi:hypothetical protein
MAKALVRRGAKRGAIHLPWLESAVAFGIGSLLYFPLHNTDLGKLTWAFGAIFAAGRFAAEARLEKALEPVTKLADVTDLTQNTDVDELRNLQITYLKITEPEFKAVKDLIIGDSRDALLRLAQDKTSGALSAGEYYIWLLPILEQTKPGSKVRALSVMMDSEWDDSPVERRFLELSIAAAERGVEIVRVFVIDEKKVGDALKNKAVRVQTKEEGPARFRGMLVGRNYLKKADPALFGRLGDGFICFDERVALIDIASPDGQARGQVTMSGPDIARLVRLHDQLIIHSTELSTSQASP